MNKSILLTLTALTLLATGCAKSAGDTTGRDAQERISLWMEKYHPGIQPDENGLYILEEEPGTGDPFEPLAGDETTDKPFVQLRSTIRTLDGTVSATTEEEMARQLGTYQYANYYGPKYYRLGEGYSYAGLDALLGDMRIGGRRKAVIPAWMLTTVRYASQEEYIRNCSGSTHLIYEVILVAQRENAEADGIARVKAFIDANYPGTESVSYVDGEEADGSFYFISDVSAFQEEDKLADESSVKINYTGKLLDGTVFDTTVRKVAVDARIDSNSKTYEPQSATITSTYSNVTMGSSSSLISGFKGALSLMHWKGQKAVAVFSSAHGYGASGSGNVIPSYEPLIFEIEILADE